MRVPYLERRSLRTCCYHPSFYEVAPMDCRLNSKTISFSRLIGGRELSVDSIALKNPLIHFAAISSGRNLHFLNKFPILNSGDLARY